ncbi:hypothetical protein PIB30_020702 [Stylosanthes scabra]|uniref:Uncharacterized protein n=1 Tax=Stylosanthes scabra TaxID=79078 RepID=A0ABU6X9B2_9FABA|nr:hypothetical protein [Stylosanthes scabra]
MGFERVLKWDWWVKQRDQRSWTKERFKELEEASFFIFVDNLLESISKKELFYLFSWSGKARNMRDNKTLEVNASPRNVAEIDIELVNGREIDSAAELVFLECIESE